MKKILLLFLCILVVFGANHPLVLLISFDGFRYNYLERTATPNFDRIIREGVKAKWIKDVFVSQTVPNHYAMATGLFEESHGIVANRFFDPVLNRSFSYNNPKDLCDNAFWGGEPIWVTNELQGRKSGVYFWAGSEAPVKNVRPAAWRKFNLSIPWKVRMDTVVEWLSNGGPDPLNITLALMYFSQPDHYGHLYGPESPEVTDMIEKCDEIIGYLIQKLEKSGIYEDLNLIITSDHGMASLNQSRSVALKPYLNMSEIDHYINHGTGAAIWPKKGFLEKAYHSLAGIGHHVRVWKKENIPAEFHYKLNRRIPPIVLLPQDKWFFVDNANDSVRMKGAHGYNNTLMDMHPFFVARGPAFRKSFVSEPFRTVDIYGLICKIARLNPAPNNGSLKVVQSLLVKPCHAIMQATGNCKVKIQKPGI